MSDSASAGQDRLAELRASAQGWQRVQLAALGFIGLCGVIQTGDATNPWGLQVMSGILVLVALVLACAGVYVVGRAAWPLYRGEPPVDAGEEATVAALSRQLARGLLMTFLSIAVLALATAASWWPKEDGDGGGDDSADIQLQTNDGRTACGELAESPTSGTLRVIADDEPVDVALQALASLSPVGSC
jgi:hypothetical protein